MLHDPKALYHYFQSRDSGGGGGGVVVVVVVKADNLGILQVTLSLVLS